MSNSSKSMGLRSRFTELDSLRGLAALSVVLFHYTIILPRFFPNAGTPTIHFGLGHYGVELFFIISGYVIFMTLGRCQYGMDFIFSRFSRIFPVFWVAVLITYLVGITFPLLGQSYTVSQFVINLSMLQEYLKVPNIDGVYWSLSYEIGFYFCMYLIFQLGLLKRIELICGLLIMGGIFFFYFKELVPHPLHYLFVINNYSHLFVAGIILFIIKCKGYTVLRLALLSSVVLIQTMQEGVLGGAIILGFIVIFLLSIFNRAAFLRHFMLVYLGTISYSLYLIHHMLGFRIIQAFQESGLSPDLSILLTIIIVLLLASALTFYIERPLLKISKSRWTERKKLKLTKKKIELL